MRSPGAVLMVLALHAAAGCTFAPPIRGFHAAMPDRVARGQLAVSAATGGFVAPSPSAPFSGELHLAYGVTDGAVVELGASVVSLPWVTTWGGVRLVKKKWLDWDLDLVADVELGAGLGLGGIGTNDTRGPWTSSQFWGVYQGAGVGLRWRWFGAFARVRLEASNSNFTNMLWPSVFLGFEARAGKHVVFSTGAGAIGLAAEERGLALGYVFYQASVAFLFDVGPVTPAARAPSW